MEVSYIFRKRRPHAFSIESLFDNIYAKINSLNQFRAYKVEMPSIINVAANLAKSSSSQATINHITGDIHYVALGMKKRNTVLTIHDCVFLTRYSKRSLKYWLFKFFWYQLPMWRASTVTVISEKTRRELVRLTGVHPDKIRVVPNFFDPRFAFEPKEFNTRKPRLLQIGTKENKNIIRLAAALKGLSCELHIVGEPDADTVAALQANRVEYYTYSNLSFDELQEQYRAADMVVFVSTYEGFGLPILEACAVGRPLVTSRISPMQEIAEDAACKVNPYSVLDIRHGILRVIEDEQYRDQLINNGWKLRYRYSIDQVAARYTDIYEEIAAAPAPDFFLVRQARAAASLLGIA
ncbi:MAG TPA: glycosyltransferase family 1 protein [Lacibacter sp.]|nr:glycosyltransferase family 1 protein [Lacibacter sp.]HMO88734.1 glycosyltransferase family 1 protein [Lacibacter sp.]HMP87411.1 glycosyltransferase family 1 protein [Lacibacter sp.]